MKFDKIKYYLDFIPLIILFVYASLLILSLSELQQQPHWKHIIGLIVLPVNMQLLIKKRKLGCGFRYNNIPRNDWLNIIRY